MDFLDAREVSVAPPPPAPGRIKRRAYILLRLAEVRERLESFVAERGAISAALGGAGASKGPEARRLRERRSYLAARILALRSEQKALAAEKSTVRDETMMEVDRTKGAALS